MLGIRQLVSSRDRHSNDGLELYFWKAVNPVILSGDNGLPRTRRRSLLGSAVTCNWDSNGDLLCLKSRTGWTSVVTSQKFNLEGGEDASETILNWT